MKKQNRIIKFRFWDKRIKNFVIPKAGGDFADIECNEWFKELQKDGLVIMQFTGLKDCHGKEIYEGDIVKSIEEYNSYTSMKSEIYGGQVYEVVWDKAGFELSPSPIVNHLISWNDVEVIGNIFENPELLKEEK